MTLAKKLTAEGHFPSMLKFCAESILLTTASTSGSASSLVNVLRAVLRLLSAVMRYFKCYFKCYNIRTNGFGLSRSADHTRALLHADISLCSWSAENPGTCRRNYWLAGQRRAACLSQTQVPISLKSAQISYTLIHSFWEISSETHISVRQPLYLPQPHHFKTFMDTWFEVNRLHTPRFNTLQLFWSLR